MDNKIITPFHSAPDNTEWRTVTVNGNYEVSEYGHVRRATDGSNSKRGKVIKPSVQKNTGYIKYHLSKNTIVKYYNVHRLVALAFIPNLENKPMVLHWDGNKQNCFKENLRWGTSSDNKLDDQRLGNIRQGVEHYLSKLTPDDVVIIRNSEKSQRVLGREYGVTQTAIWAVKNRISWKHIEG